MISVCVGVTWIENRHGMCWQMGSLAMVMHHAVAAVSLVAALSSRQGHMYTLLLLATEMTTPFINARWHLDVLVSHIHLPSPEVPCTLQHQVHRFCRMSRTRCCLTHHGLIMVFFRTNALHTVQTTFIRMPFLGLCL
jgi:hypothetical protein